MINFKTVYHHVTWLLLTVFKVYGADSKQKEEQKDWGGHRLLGKGIKIVDNGGANKIAVIVRD